MDLKKGLFIIIAAICLILGFIGMFFPLLPTTPFWLLSAYLLVNSSPPLHARLMRMRYVGNHIRQFQEQRAISLRNKVVSITVLWISILFSAFYFLSYWWLVVLLLIIAIGVTIHILSYKTLR